MHCVSRCVGVCVVGGSTLTLVISVVEGRGSSAAKSLPAPTRRTASGRTVAMTLLDVELAGEPDEATQAPPLPVASRGRRQVSSIAAPLARLGRSRRMPAAARDPHGTSPDGALLRGRAAIVFGCLGVLLVVLVAARSVLGLAGRQTALQDARVAMVQVSDAVASPRLALQGNEVGTPVSLDEYALSASLRARLTGYAETWSRSGPRPPRAR